MAVGVSMVEVVLLLLGWGSFFGTSDVAPLPEDPVVAQVAPEECLFYSSWAGKTQVSPDATSSTERLFSDPKFLAYLDRIEKLLHKTISQGVKPRGIDDQHIEGAFHLLSHLHSHAGSFYLSEINAKRNQPPEIFGGLIIRVDDDDLDRLAETLASLLQRVPEQLRSTVKINDSQFSRIEAEKGVPPITWGIRENYLVLGIGEGEAEKIVARLHDSVPDWLIEAKKGVETPRPASFVHLDTQRLFSTLGKFLEPHDADVFAGVLEAFGIDAIESFSYGEGLDDQGFVNRGLLKLSGELSGMLALLDCEPLVAADFQQISSDSPVALAFQLNLADVLTAYIDSCEHEMAPQYASDTARQLRQQFEMMRNALGIDIRNDLLASIGDTWRVYAQPGPQALINGWTLSVDLADTAKFTDVHRVWLNLIQNGNPFEVVTEEYEDTTIYSVPVPGFPIVPSWCIHDDLLTVSTSVDNVEQTVSGEAPDKTLAETDQVQPFLEDGKRTFKLINIDMAAVMELALPLIAQQLDSLPKGVPIDSSMLPPLEIITQYLRPTVIAVERTAAGVEITHRGTLPGIGLGQAAPLLVAATLPAASAARDAAHLNQSRNHQKQIALSMHLFADVNGGFPAGYSADDDGKPLLSWRVHVLPYLEQQALYNQFHLDEPWDSPHNKKLIPQMPEIYDSPLSEIEQGKTTYLGVGGADGVFVRPQPGSNSGVQFREITDGTSLTAMMIEASDDRAIAWTRPGDFAPQADDPHKGLRVDARQRMSLVFADGSVQSVNKNIVKETLMSFFTKSGGEIVERR